VEASKTVIHGLIMGIDHSQIMLAQASQRNADGLASGRVVLTLGSVAMLAELKGVYNNIFTVNVFQFWDGPVAMLRALRSLPCLGGMLATTYMPPQRGATDQDAITKGDTIAACLKEAGLTRIQCELKPMKPVSAVCVRAIPDEARA